VITNYKVDIEKGLIIPCQFMPSPNYDDRPTNTEIELVVIHCISLPPAIYGGHEVIDFFQNNLNENVHPYFAKIIHLRVSSHLFIDRKGELYQFVPLDKRAWHAGESNYLGRENCNDFSIGIELEGIDTDAFEDRQYHTLAKVIICLSRYYSSLTETDIIGHSDIAPKRKKDPGKHFKWDYLKKLIQKYK
jgi:AmpD protein